jgi:AcrR family transcriptional regulator
MTSPAARARLTAAERRDLILAGAMQVFAEQGYNDASMTEIARAAGITAAVIYDHFASKQELHEMLLETQSLALVEFVGTRVLAADEDPSSRLRVGIDAFFAFVESHPFAWRLIFRDPPADPDIAAVHTRINLRATQAISVLIGFSAPDPLPTGGDRDQTLEMYGHMLKSSLNGLAAWWYEHRDVPRQAMTDRVMEFCWIGLDQLASTPPAKGED